MYITILHSSLLQQSAPFFKLYLIKEFQRLKEDENNAQIIREGGNKTERFYVLKKNAEYQLNILTVAEQIKLIEWRGICY